MTALYNHDPHPLFPVLLACDLEDLDPDKLWLIDSLWTRTGVGVIGGSPKCAKSWLALDLALSVASATPALDRFNVHKAGPVLLFMAEDAAAVVKARLLALCRHRNLDLKTLPIHVITTPCLRLDLENDRKKLSRTVAAIAPCLLLLDPFVRLHCLNENDSSAVSAMLAYLRTVQRRYQLGIIIVHHMRKNARSLQAGQNLRGSGDFHAWSDDSLYLRRHANDQLLVTPEHRSTSPGDPFLLALVSSNAGDNTHLQILDRAVTQTNSATNLEDKVLSILAEGPVTRGALRQQLGIRNQRLGDLLERLGADGLIVRGPNGLSRSSPH